LPVPERERQRERRAGAELAARAARLRAALKTYRRFAQPRWAYRHTWGKLLAALDVHPRVAMQILGHSRIAITIEISEVPTEATRAALRRLGDHLEGAKPDGNGGTEGKA
jgi:hypothetical protein